MSAFSKTELWREAHWRRYRDNPELFFREAWHIQHPEQGSILFDPFKSQIEALDTFQTERYVITLKARQVGWTTLVAAYAFWHAFFHPDRLIIFLSKGEREAASILQKVTYGYARLPPWLRERGPQKQRHNQTLFDLDNGSSVESLPSKSDPARGRSCYLVVVDEWSFLENPKEAWASIEPIADIGGRVIGLSTANGWGTFFHELWLGAVKGDNQFSPIFEPWSARDDRDGDWYDTKKRTLPAWQLHQEYPQNPDEAFLKSGNPFFDVDALGLIEPITPKKGFLSKGDFVTFVQQQSGALSLWEHPHHQESYVIGADVAEGLDFGDFSSAHVIHWRTHKVVAHWHGHVPPEEFAEVLSNLGEFYNHALLGVESNNHGLTTCKYLKDMHRYPNMFYMRTIDERSQRISNKIGWYTSKKSRPVMLDGLAESLRDGSLQLHDVRTLTELRTFVRDETGKLRGSPFDDCVISLAIAVQMLDYCTQHHAVRGQAEYGTLEWWDQQARHQDLIPAIGAHNIRS